MGEVRADIVIDWKRQAYRKRDRDCAIGIHAEVDYLYCRPISPITAPGQNLLRGMT